MVDSKLNNPLIESNHGKIDLSKALELRLKNNLSYAEIAKYFDCSPSAVCQRFKGLLDVDPDELRAYKEHRADVFAGLGSKILNSLDVKKLPEQVKVTQAAILYDKERLERGQSTSNVFSVSASLANMERIKAEIEQLERSIGVDKSNYDGDN